MKSMRISRTLFRNNESLNYRSSRFLTARRIALDMVYGACYTAIKNNAIFG